MMPPSTQPGARDELVAALLDLFRRKGYDGVSLADISDATGLGRSSLYHHFPGGKEEMAEAVLAFARQTVEREVLGPLAAPGKLGARIDAMLAGVRRLYEGGAAPCVLASLLQGEPGGPVGAGVSRIFADWIAAVAAALRDAGESRAAAERRALAAMARIQGALVLARALDRKDVFSDALKAAREELAA